MRKTRTKRDDTATLMLLNGGPYAGKTAALFGHAKERTLTFSACGMRGSYVCVPFAARSMQWEPA